MVNRLYAIYNHPDTKAEKYQTAFLLISPFVIGVVASLITSLMN